MSGFTKLHGSILDSTIWREPDHVRLVWITMLAMADARGVVEASLPGLADRARVSLDDCQSAIARLTEADQWSRTADHDGRRINHECKFYRERPDRDGRWRGRRHRAERRRGRWAAISTDPNIGWWWRREERQQRCKRWRRGRRLCR